MTPYSTTEISDGFTTLDGQSVYRIGEVDQLAPFMMNVVSATDTWLFLTSCGGLTAGRVDADLRRRHVAEIAVEGLLETVIGRGSVARVGPIRHRCRRVDETAAAVV